MEIKIYGSHLKGTQDTMNMKLVCLPARGKRMFNPDHGYCGWADSSHTLCDFCADPDLRDSEHTIHCVNTKGYGSH